MAKFIRKFEDWEVHHKLIAFSFIMLATILITRGLVMIHDPNPAIFNFELHHFDYGLMLLFVACLLLLFGRRNRPAYLIIAAIAFGLIIDDLWFIRANVSVTSSNPNETAIYNATFLQTLILVKLMTILAILISHYVSKKRKQRPDSTKKVA